ncbi:MAG TPA: hypothetical protein VEQ60_16800 [Longimicrobium sp.]|nr:hypothetical protein [Longimicrobium sp.]
MLLSRIRPAWLLLAMGLAGCAARRTNTPPPPPLHERLERDAPRCYELNAARNLYFAPRRIRLGAGPVTGDRAVFAGDSARALTRLTPDGRAIVEERRPILYWKPVSADSIRIVISTGFSGSGLTVGARTSADTLRGRAEEFWDMGPTQNDGGSVTLIRVPCVTQADDGTSPAHRDVERAPAAPTP